MASGHMNRVKRPDTWLHRPMLQNVKKILANPEVAVDTVIAVKWNFYCFVSHWHKSVLEVWRWRQARALPRAPSGSGA